MRKQSIDIIIPLQMHSFTQQTFINKQFILNSSNGQLMKYVIKEKNGLISYVLIALSFFPTLLLALKMVINDVRSLSG